MNFHRYNRHCPATILLDIPLPIFIDDLSTIKNVDDTPDERFPHGTHRRSCADGLRKASRRVQDTAGREVGAGDVRRARVVARSRQ